MAMLYRIAVYEVDEKIPTEAYTTRCKEPIKLARRYLRFVNYAWNKPGGYDKVVFKAEVSAINIWPAGDSFMGAVKV